MSPGRGSVFERVATWLVAEDDRGSAAVGDLLELHAGWRTRHGKIVAAGLIALEIVRSAPAYLLLGLSERGAAWSRKRSAAALLAGCAAAAFPVALLGSAPAPSGGPTWTGFVFGLATAGASALAGGWLAAGLARSAPRQHALAVGVTLAVALGVLAAAGRIEESFAQLAAWQTCVVVCAAWGGARWRSGRRPRAATLATGLLAIALVGCGDAERRGPEPVTRSNLSGDHNDWEPSLAVGGDGTVHVIAARRPPQSPDSANPFGVQHSVTWTSTDGGSTFAEARTYPFGGGDSRVRAAADGTLYASWIRVEWDSLAGGPDMERGGLVLATSRERGERWETTLAAPMGSGVADKPELAVSADGRSVFIAFMARGTLDVVASHDGGRTWTRHVADSTRTGHWPTSIALAPGGDLWVANARNAGAGGDTLLVVDVELLHSRDDGATWDVTPLGRSTRVARADACVHGPTCAVQIPYASVAVDDAGGVYVVQASGEAGSPYALWFLSSADGGTTWTGPTPLSAAARPVSGDRADVYYPMVAAAGQGLVYAVWFDDRDGPIGVWAKRSVDGGRTWGQEVRLSDADGLTGVYGEYGGAAVDADGVLHVAWAEGTGHVGRGGHGGTWYARWDGRGG